MRMGERDGSGGSIQAQVEEVGHLLKLERGSLM